jgi:hypothetical protein
MSNGQKDIRKSGYQEEGYQKIRISGRRTSGNQGIRKKDIRKAGYQEEGVRIRSRQVGILLSKQALSQTFAFVPISSRLRRTRHGDAARMNSR